MTRPERLFPLFADLETLDGVGPKTARAFAALGVERPKDLLFLLPSQGIDRSRRASIREVLPPVTVTVEVTVGAHFPPRRKGGPYRVMVQDAATEFQLVFFHARSDYLAKLLPTGQRRLVSGKVEIFDSVAQMVHPDHVLRPEEAGDLPAFEPVYPLAQGLTQRVVARAAQAAVARAGEMPEWIDGPLKAREGWPDWQAAIAAVHGPASAADLSPTAPARQRLAYDELLAHQLTLALARAQVRKGKGVASIGTRALQDKVLKSLPYAPTGAQTRAVAEIAADLAAPLRMNRLLQGDVGSGKTLVAFMALLVAVEAGGQGVMMAPTEILARQHMEGLAPLAAAAGVRVEPGRELVRPKKGALCGDPGLRGEKLAPITGKVRGCGIEEPVRVTEVDGVRLSTPATLDCPTARALRQWVETGLKPAVGRAGVAEIKVAAHYACRSRNNRPGAPISEHGRGRAIDIAGIRLGNGELVTVLGDYRGSKVLQKARRAACGIFGTTLGPGSDRFHNDHLHFDTARHRNGPYCR